MRSSKQTCMLQERSAQSRSAAHSVRAFADLATDLSQMVAAEICHLRRRYRLPEELHRVQIGRIGRKVFRPQPVALAAQVRLGVGAFVRLQTIPQENQSPSFQISPKVAQVRADLRTSNRSVEKAQAQTNPPALPGRDQRRNGRKPLPVEGADQDRGLALESPCAADVRLIGKAAFVQKPNQGLPPSAFFLIRGKSSRIQRWIAASSRSLARCSGRWQLQPNCPRIRHT